MVGERHKPVTGRLRANGITGESLLWATRAALPWLMILLLSLIIITYVPQVSLFLPELIDRLRGFG